MRVAEEQFRHDSPSPFSIAYTLKYIFSADGIRKYAPAYMVLEGLEKDARGAKKGLWADPQPVPP
jgi:hypothetical protein